MRIGLESQNFHIEHSHTGVAQASKGLLLKRTVSDQREVMLFGRGRYQAKPHVAVTGAGGDLDHFWRRQLKDGQGCQGNDSIGH